MDDVAVIGIPHAEFEEQLKAIIQPTAGVASDDAPREAPFGHCRTKLAGYKVPRSIDFHGALPRTETGKLQKRLLREPFWAGLARKI